MKVLVIEDDVLLKDFIVMCLKTYGFDVDSVIDGEKGFYKARTNKYDVLVLDVNLPQKSGLDVCKDLRDEGVMTPILFLSGNHTMEDRVRGFEVGGDDYLVKPFIYNELVVRVKALARRYPGYIRPIISYANLTVDTERRRVTYNGKTISLTPKEFELLEILIRNAEKVLTREYLLEYIWGVTLGNTSNRLEVCIRGLRRKLLTEIGSDVIYTEYGVGYKLSSDE